MDGSVDDFNAIGYRLKATKNVDFIDFIKIHSFLFVMCQFFFFFLNSEDKNRLSFFNNCSYYMASFRAKGCTAKTAEVTGGKASEPGGTDALLRGFTRG